MSYICETPLLTFIIPVRHPENSKNWDIQVYNLMNTLNSIANQEDPGWQAFVVLNVGAKIPELPDKVYIEWVDFPPNNLHEISKFQNRRNAMLAFGIDKGRRVEAALKRAHNSKYIMIVDDDDFVSCHLTDYVRQNKDRNGWYIERGFGIDFKGSFKYKLSNFHKTSGTSHIVRTDIFPEAPLDSKEYEMYLCRWFGFHGAMTETLERAGFPLEPLPFEGATYLLNHPNSHSSTNTIFRNYIFNRSLFCRPLEIFERIHNIGIIDRKFRKEFLGDL